jgi:hypothetical protein
MLREIYMLLKQRLSTEVAALKHVDWHLEQTNQDGDDPVPITPAAYIAFEPIPWGTQGRSGQIQKGLLEFQVLLISDTAYGDDRDMTDKVYINHLAIEQAIYQALQTWRGRISMLTEYAALSGTPNDVWLLETIVRTQSDPHNILDTRIQTSQTFQCQIFDYAAVPQLVQAMASLNLTCV